MFPAIAHQGKSGHPFPGQCLLYVEHALGIPSFVFLVQYVASEVAVGHASVQYDAGGACHAPLCEDVERGEAAVHDVSERGVEDVVVIVEAVLFYASVRYGLHETGTQHQFLIVEAVGEPHAVRLLYLQVFVAVGEGGRFRTVHIGVEIGNAGSRYAHVVRGPDVLARLEGVGDGGRGYEAAVVLPEVLPVPVMVAYVLPGVLVSHSSLGRPFLPAVVALHVGRPYLVAVLVVGAAQRIEHLVSVRHGVVVHVAGATSEGILHTIVQGAVTGHLVHHVRLHDVFLRVLPAIAVAVAGKAGGEGTAVCRLELVSLRVLGGRAETCLIYE